MPRKILKNAQEEAAKRGLSPIAFLFDRLEDRIKAKDWGHAERLALDLVPYCHHKLAAKPAPEVTEAMEQGRLVIVATPSE